MPGKPKKNGGRTARIGDNFHEAIEKIRDEKIRNKTSKSRDRISTEKITNLIIRHKSWPEISQHIELASESEVEQYGF